MRETQRKLVCSIEGGAGKTVQINHLSDGIAFGLTGDVEKRSELLGRNALWTKTTRIARLPKYLCVQMMRCVRRRAGAGRRQ
jgi:ubiquitin carboxyl-terminal hydrolase 14